MNILFLKHKSVKNYFREFDDEINIYASWLIKHDIPVILSFEEWDDELQWKEYGTPPNNFYALDPDYMKSLGSKAFWNPGQFHLIFYCYYPEKEKSANIYATMNWFRCNGGIGITVPLTKEMATLPTQWGWRMLVHESIHAFIAILNLVYHKNIIDNQDQLYHEYIGAISRTLLKQHPNATENDLTHISENIFETSIKPYLNLLNQPLPEKQTGQILLGIISILTNLLNILKQILNENTEDKKQKVIKQLAQVIATQEGFWVSGSLPQRLNNPGALIYVGQENSIRDDSGFAHFVSAEAGWNALYKQLDLIFSGKSRYYTPEMTIQEFVDRWASISPEDERLAYANAIAKAFGVDINTPLNQLKIK